MDKKFRKLLDRYRVESGKGFSLRDHDPDDTGGLKPAPQCTNRTGRLLRTH